MNENFTEKTEQINYTKTKFVCNECQYESNSKQDHWVHWLKKHDDRQLFLKKAAIGGDYNDESYYFNSFENLKCHLWKDVENRYDVENQKWFGEGWYIFDGHTYQYLLLSKVLNDFKDERDRCNRIIADMERILNEL